MRLHPGLSLRATSSIGRFPSDWSDRSQAHDRWRSMIRKIRINALPVHPAAGTGAFPDRKDASMQSELGRSGDAPTRSRFNAIYRTIVMSLALMVIGAAVLPKQRETPRSVATIELSLTEPWSDPVVSAELLEEARNEILSPASLRETVDLAWSQWIRTHRVDDPLDRDAWVTWAASALTVQPSDQRLSDYLHVEIGVEGTDDSFVVHLVNQAAISLSDQIERRLLRDDVHARWEREHSRLHDSLSARRRWLERLDETVSKNQGTASVWDAPDRSSISSGSAELESEPLPPQIDLALAELEMLVEQLRNAIAVNGWSTSHPEYQSRLTRIETLKEETRRMMLAAGRSPDRLTNLGPTIQENRFYTGDRETTSPVPSPGGDSSAQLVSLKQEAAERIDADEALLVQLASWMDGSSDQSSRARLVELAEPVPAQGASLPSGQWVLLLVGSLSVATVITWNLARQPSRFFSTQEITHELGLPHLGSFPGGPPAPTGFWISLKRRERKLQTFAEATLMLAVALVGLALLLEPRLFTILLDRPLDGLARCLDIALGR